MEKSNAVNLFLEKSIKYLESAEAFASKEIPVYIEELLKWELANSCIYFVLFLFVLIVSSLVFYNYTIKKSIDYNGEKITKCRYNVDYYLISAVSSLMALIASINLICHFLNIVKINIAPKVYLIEYLKDLTL